MENKKVLALICCMVMLLFAACPGSRVFRTVNAQASEATIADVKTDAALEDFAGEYICTSLMMQGNLIPATLEAMQTAEKPTLTIKGDEATFTGLEEMGTDPVKLTFEDGQLYFEPEKDVRVFTLHLLQDGMVTMKFNMIEMAPVFCFTAAEEPRS